MGHGSVEWQEFSSILSRFSKAAHIEQDDILFGSGLNLSSIRFTEFIMTLEEETGVDIDIDGLDASIKTAGQLYERILGSTEP